MAQDVSVSLSDLRQLDRLLAQARMTIRQLSQREERQETARRRFIETSEEIQETFAGMSSQEKADVIDAAIRSVRSHA
jgi:uncharacterized membrane protein YccC